MIPKNEISALNRNSNTVLEREKKIPKEYLEIAEGMETQFVDLLFNEMNKTVSRENPESSADSYYNSMMNYERAQMASKQGQGIGLKRVILDQIYPQASQKPLRTKSDNIEIASQDVKLKAEK